MMFRNGQNALALAVGGLALAIFTTGTAVATTGQLVHVGDPTTGMAAKVYGGGKLLVGDGSGAVTVDGTVTARETPPNQLTRAWQYTIASNGCMPLLTAPADRAIVVKTILTNVTGNPNSGSDYVAYFLGTATSLCDDYVTHVTPTTLGFTPVPLEPGIVVPAGRRLYVRTLGDLAAYSTAIGYFIPASAAPATSTEGAGSSPDGPPLP